MLSDGGYSSLVPPAQKEELRGVEEVKVEPAGVVAKRIPGEVPEEEILRELWHRQVTRRKDRTLQTISTASRMLYRISLPRSCMNTKLSHPVTT